MNLEPTLSLRKNPFTITPTKPAKKNRRNISNSNQEKNQNRYEELFNIILITSLLNLLIYIISASFIKYDLSADELYYLACANRLDFGYVDFPPLSVWILGVWKFVSGDSIFVLRLLPAIISSATVVMIGLFTAKLGGRKNSVLIAMITFMLSPVFLGASSIYSLNVFDFFFWILTAYIYLLIIQSGKTKLWYTLGIVIGLGLLNSTSVVWLVAGLLIGTVLSPAREDLKTKNPYIALGIATLLFLPYIIWNFTNNFVHIQFIRDVASGKSGSMAAASSIIDLIIILNPVSVLIWGPGILFIMFNWKMRKYRAFGYIWLVTFAAIFFNWHSRIEYVAPSFQILFASGSLMIVKWNARHSRLKYALVVPVVVLGIILAPLTHPFLPINNLVDYQSLLHIKSSVNDKNGIEGLSRYCIRMIGWNSMAGKISEVYLSLSEDERSNTLIYCPTYGEAGAIEYYSDQFKLPGAICPQNNFWYWWNEKREPTTMIFMGGNIKEYLDYFETVEVAGYYKPEYSLPYGYNPTIFICRGFKGSFENIRRKDKTFI